MRYADFHCDVLWKLIENQSLSFLDSSLLDVTPADLEQVNSVLQTFAIYIPPTHKQFGTMKPIWESIDAYESRVLAVDPRLRPILTSADLNECAASPHYTGALLSLEGADGLAGNIQLVRELKARGVRSVGLTWNDRNWTGDGVLTPEDHGLTELGREFVSICDEEQLILDVSHLSDTSFWDLAETSERPLVASHSNVRKVCNHPRNLSDEMIRELIGRDGLIGLTFVPPFIKPDEVVSKDGFVAGLDDLCYHIEHVCMLGGAKNLVFGSDFDGFDRKVMGLTRLNQLELFKEKLIALYDEHWVQGWLSNNLISFLRNNLPNA